MMKILEYSHIKMNIRKNILYNIILRKRNKKDSGLQMGFWKGDYEEQLYISEVN